MFRLFSILLFLMFFHSAYAVQYREMLGTTFPSLSESGPSVSTRRAEFKLLVANGKAEFDLKLDAPEKARMLIMGEDKAEVRIFQDNLAWDEKDLAVKQDVLSLVGVGRQLGLDALPPGRYKVSVSNLRKGKVTVMIDQPLTKYPLQAKLTPFVARMHDELEVIAWFDEPEALEAVKMRVHFGQRQWPMRRVGERYHAKVKLNFSEESDAIQHLSVVADADDNEKSGAQRKLPLSFLLSKPVTGFEEKVFVSETGALHFSLMPAKGHFRLDVLYGFEGKAIAMARDYLQLDGEGRSHQIDRPDFAKAANKALLRLFNMATLEVEDQALVLLPIDRAAQRSFQHKPSKPQELTEQEKEALKSLDVQDKHPNSHAHHQH